jgi:hypothetical protein
VNICHLTAGIYRIVVTLNPSNWLLKSDYTNNVGWTSFELEQEKEGNPTVRTIPDSKKGIWFDQYAYNPSPTASMWPTYECATYSTTISLWPTYECATCSTTKSVWPSYEPVVWSLNPTTTYRPSMCMGNTPDWENYFFVECDWYEEVDMPGCELYGYGYEFVEDFM